MAAAVAVKVIIYTLKAAGAGWSTGAAFCARVVLWAGGRVDISVVPGQFSRL